MELFDYLMAKKGHNTSARGDLFSYLLGKKGSGGSGTYTTFSGTSLNISNTIKAAIKKFMLNSTELTQDGTPTPDNPVDVNVITGDNNIKISDGTEEQNYPITLSSKNLLDFDNINITRLGNDGNVSVSDNEIVFTATGQQVYGVTIDLAGLNLKNNTTYTVANLFNITTTQSPSGWRYYNGSSYTALNNYREYFTFTTTESGVNQLLYYIGSPATFDGTLTIYNIQLLEGLVQQQNLPTYESYYNIEYCKIGDYADQIFKNATDSEFYDSTLLENEWYLKKNIEKKVFNGAESGFNPGGVDNLTYRTYWEDTTVAFNNTDEIKVLCNHLNGNTPNEIITNQQVGISTRRGTSQGLYMRVSTTIANDLTSFLQWLSEVNPIVYYVLETPSYIHISQEDYPILRSQLENLYNNAKSYDGQTNITQTNDDLPFNISVNVKVLDTNLNMSNSLNSSLLSNNLQNEEETSLGNTNEIDEIEEPIEEYEEL